MNRWIWFTGCALLGLLMLACGWLAPAHLRATDLSLVQQAGENGPALVERGLQLTRDGKLGAAQWMSQAARAENVRDREKLESAVHALAEEHPGWLRLGGDDPVVARLVDSGPRASGSQPFTDFVLQQKHREQALALLAESSIPAVQALLRLRRLTNTVIFPPSRSAAGQPLDAAIATCGLLLEGGHLTTRLNNTILTLATRADGGGKTQPIEGILMDFLSLGQRLNWGQLAEFVSQVREVEALNRLAGLVRRDAGQLPILFAAVELSGKPEAVSQYLVDFSHSGLADLGSSLGYGGGGVSELLERNRQLYRSELRQNLAAHAPIGAFSAFASAATLRMPRVMLIVKLFLYLCGGFLLAAAMHFARPPVSELERPLQVRGFHLAREFLFALGFLLVVLLLSEPFLARESQRAAILPFRLHVSTVGAVAQAGNTGVKSSFMNQSNFLIILLFFVLQGLLYTASVVKLAEIRRQRVGPRMKLKLLENEEHLFDAGLYLGFLGTIISFIVYSLFAHHQFSLMVAYSSTSFGILFVSFFKIFHLRPVRRRLLLEAEVSSSETLAPTATPTFVSS